MIGPLLDHLWQSTLFAGLAGLLTLMLRNNGAAARFWLWFAASVKFLVPFAALAALGAYALAPLAAPLSVPAIAHIERLARPFSTPAMAPAEVRVTPGFLIHTERAVPAASAAPSASSAHLAHPPAIRRGAALPDWLAHIELGAVLGTPWITGVLILILRWLVRWRRMRALLKDAVEARITAPVAVKFSSSRLEPGLAGILNPVILLPQGIEQKLSPEELKAVIAHELCHLRRRDNLLAAIHMLVESLFWFFPPVWWLGGCLEAERERACDESVVAEGNDPKVYAQGILKICRIYLHSPLACAAGVSGAGLKSRIETILKDRTIPRLSMARKLGLGACGAAALAVPISLGLMAAPVSQTKTQMAAKAVPISVRAARNSAGLPSSSEPAGTANQTDTGISADAMRPAPFRLLAMAKLAVPSPDWSRLLPMANLPMLVASYNPPAAPAATADTASVIPAALNNPSVAPQTAWPAQPNCTPPRLVNSLPMDRVAGSDLMTVAAAIEGSPERLLVGTGAVYTEVWHRTAQGLDLVTGDPGPPWDFAGRLSDGGTAVRNVTLGSLSTRTFSPVIVMPDPDTAGAGFNGLLGTSMMKQWDIDLDFAHRRLNYFSPEQCVGAGVYWNPTTITAVPMVVKGPLIFVPVTLDGHAIIAMLDTGADRTFLNPRVASRLFGLKAGALEAGNVMEAGAVIKAGMHTFSRLALGGLIATHAQIAIPFDRMVQSDKIFHGNKDANRVHYLDEILPDMVIGMDLLKYTHLYISFQNQRVYISAAGEGPALTPAVLETSTFNVGASQAVWPVSTVSSQESD